MDEIEQLEQRLEYLKKAKELEAVMHTMACPVCGARLTGYIGKNGCGDDSMVRSSIFCDSCKCFRYDSKYHSFYASRMAGCNAGEEVIEYIKPYIKKYYIE